MSSFLESLDLNQRSLGFYTRNSFIIHVLLVAACLAFAYHFHDLINDRKKINIKLIESSVRVDIVAMPKLTIKELKNLERLAPPPSEKVEEPVIEKTQTPPTEDTKGPELLKEAKKTSFADLLKGYSQKKLPESKIKKNVITKPKKASTPSTGLTHTDRNVLAGLLKEGNKLKKGTSLTGDENSAALEGAFIGYLGEVRDWVKPQWKLPSYLTEQGLNCRVQVFLDSNGKLLKAAIYESSGNDEYDQKAINAVKRSSPFPIPDSEIRGRVSQGHMILGFPL